jgi:hypothetical protein
MRVFIYPPEALIQLADQNQAGIRGDARTLKRDLQKPVERELKGLGFSLTHRVSPILVGFLMQNPRQSRRGDYSDGQKYHS